jgi:RHS repeat-associated protein
MYVRGIVINIYNDTTVLEQPIYGSSRLGMYKHVVQEGAQTLGQRSYELSNHLGNVLAVITDNIHMAGDSAWTTVSSASEYYPFGLDMEGRSWRDTTALATRYGFNGKEKDSKQEWGSTTYDYGFRIYNPTIAKFLSVDPLTKSYPWYTPYQFAGNNPIQFIDLDGLEPACPEHGKKNLLIVVQGWGQVNPNDNETQVINAGSKHKHMKRDDDLGQIELNLTKKFNTLQAVTFASSASSNTIDDIAQTIKDFVTQNPDSKIITVGHSLGGENLIKMLNQFTEIKVDLLITLDPRGTSSFRSSTENKINGNVKNVINYWQYMTSGISGVELIFGDKVNGINVEVIGTSHTTIDRDLKTNVESDISDFLFDKPVVKKASILGTIDINKRVILGKEEQVSE